MILSGLAEKFWSQVRKTEGCWEWTGYRQRGLSGELRYGRFTLPRSVARSQKVPRQPFAHRVAYQLANGAISNDVLILHTCDNPICVCPSHLFIGTHLDNVIDMIQKGRKATPRPTRLYGESNPRHKLMAVQVEQILKLKTQGLSQMKIARKFNISAGSIQAICEGKTWRAVSGGKV